MFTVTAFTSEDSDKFVVELGPMDKVNSFPNSCTTLTVTGEYASLFWFFNLGSGPTRAEHKAAVALIGDAFKSKTPLQFGRIGDGVNVTNRTGACNATGRGLMAEDEFGAVFSFFKWP